MTIAYSEFLFIIFLLPLIIFIQIRQYSLRRIDFRKLGADTRSNQSVSSIESIFTIKYFLSSLCFNVVFVCLVLALSGLSWGDEPVSEDRSGMEIMYLVDVSYSMLAEDISPNRLERAKNIIQFMNIPNAQFGLIAFKGSSSMLLPPTEDIQALENVLNYVDTEVVSTPGSNLEIALNHAIDLFSAVSNRNQFIVVFSDGDVLSGNSIRSAHRAAEFGIPVYAYGLGSENGSLIPIGDSVLQYEGSAVISQLNSRELREIARISRGEYFQEGRGDIRQSLINDSLQREDSGFRLASVPRYRIFLLLAFIFIIAMILIRIVKIRNAF